MSLNGRDFTESIEENTFDPIVLIIMNKQKILLTNISLMLILSFVHDFVICNH